MRTAIALALLGVCLVACGDNLVPGSGTDGAEVDATPNDGRVDAPIDANCPLRQPGQVGGACTTNMQCDSTSGAGDGFCLDATDAGIGWPATGYCVTKIGVCTQDSECGAGNVCVTINDPGGAFSACMPACGADPCACGNGQVCSNNLATSPMNKMACIPGNSSSVDGDPCMGFGECDVNSICRSDPLEIPDGQCIQIGCTIGNDATCTSGGDGHCADPGFVTAGNGCLDECVNDSDCRLAEGYKCFDGGGATGRYCRHPNTGDACAVDADCGDAAIWDCRTGVTYPGGYCTPQAQCTVGTNAGCSSGSSVCYDPAGPGTPYCIDRCSGAGQGTCRTGYLCAALGNVAGCI